MFDDRWFEQLAAETRAAANDERAPGRLKSKIYSTVTATMAEAGSLLSLTDSKRAGGRLCVFEQALVILPVGTEVRSMNPCRVCHARVLAERMNDAPIFWPGCPYSEFHQS